MFKNKLVAVVNKKINSGTLMNAVAHMCLGFGAYGGPSELHLMDYIDADGVAYPNISKMPFIILQEDNSNRIARILAEAKKAGIKYSAFTDTMIEGTWQDQASRTQEKKSGEIGFYGIVLFGEHEVVTALTKKLSLYKARSSDGEI